MKNVKKSAKTSKLKVQNQNVCCHYCRLSKNRKRSVDMNYLYCTTCSHTICKNCLETYLHLKFDDVSQNPTWSCLCCSKDCCCSYVECTKGHTDPSHKHCFTYRRTKKRHAKNLQRHEDIIRGTMLHSDSDSSFEFSGSLKRSSTTIYKNNFDHVQKKRKLDDGNMSSVDDNDDDFNGKETSAESDPDEKLNLNQKILALRKQINQLEVTLDELEQNNGLAPKEMEHVKLDGYANDIPEIIDFHFSSDVTDLSQFLREEDSSSNSKMKLELFSYDYEDIGERRDDSDTLDISRGDGEKIEDHTKVGYYLNVNEMDELYQMFINEDGELLCM